MVKYEELSLNPYLESLVKYIAENYTQRTGDNTLWYRKLPDNSPTAIFYGGDAFTHKAVVENWVVERARDLI